MTLNNGWMNLYIHANRQQFKIIAVVRHAQEVAFIPEVIAKTAGLIAIDDNGYHYIASFED